MARRGRQAAGPRGAHPAAAPGPVRRGAHQVVLHDPEGGGPGVHGEAGGHALRQHVLQALPQAREAHQAERDDQAAHLRHVRQGVPAAAPAVHGALRQHAHLRVLQPLGLPQGGRARGPVQLQRPAIGVLRRREGACAQGDPEPLKYRINAFQVAAGDPLGRAPNGRGCGEGAAADAADLRLHPLTGLRPGGALCRVLLQAADDEETGGGHVHD
mmetsp:Transcript_51625/g.162215  ORF Transcript_51625/g.162215 Transcript_51625/m.162215 type:complete len:214 (-) Transcript_51625:499-1140(-)